MICEIQDKYLNNEKSRIIVIPDGVAVIVEKKVVE